LCSNEYEPDENFFVALRRPSDGAQLGKNAIAEVTIINDDLPGTFQFEQPMYTVRESDGTIELSVTRKDGSSGEVQVNYRTTDGTAIAEKDYVAIEGTLVFNHGETLKTFSITIVDDEQFEKDETFNVELEIVGHSEVSGTQYGDFKKTTITISNDEELAETLDKVALLMNLNMDKLDVSTSTWAEQMCEAVTVQAEGEEIETMDYVMHFLTFGWKIIFSLVPPTNLGGGWVSFWGALIFIALLTMVVGDIADIFGCTIGLPKAITAFTFVALGTSLPDLFASKAAAIGDETADNSVGNVTGSNSVNVFLGLGLPWVLGAVYKSTQDVDPENPWKSKYLVEAGDLSFSVYVFVGCSILCLCILGFRQSQGWGMLGGPAGPKKITGVIFVSLWFVYVIMSSLKAIRAI
jgi:solute carrier family 8 (sodium/calcium exchanger)